MTVELQIALDRSNLMKFRRLLVASKTEAAKALTFTGERAQDAWREGNSVFHRRTNWIDKGIRLQAATPSRLEARVGSIDKYMGRHVVGVDEDKRSAGRGIFVPLYNDIDTVPSHRAIRSRLQRMGGTSRQPFWLETRFGRMLARRDGAGSTGLTILGVLRANVKIKHRLDAVGIVERTVQREFPTVYERLITRWSETQ